jgi:hypothetical protein
MEGDEWNVRHRPPLVGIFGVSGAPSSSFSKFPQPTKYAGRTAVKFATMENALMDDSQWLYENGFDLSTPALLDFDSPDAIGQRQHKAVRTGQESQEPVQTQDLSKCCPYTINWTLCLKKMRLHKLTGNAVQNIDRYPSVLWNASLKSEIDAIVQEKGLDRGYEPDETQITLSINARGEQDVPKRFTGHDVDWSEVDEQIESWSNLVSRGRRLTIKVIFIFKETTQLASTRTGRTGRNATETQLNERATLLQNSITEVPIWEQVYDLFECPGSGCEIGPYCWRNPETGIRHAVTTSILLKIVEYVEKGGKLKEHSDLPKHYRNEILNPPTKRKQADGPQINITNVIPGSEATPPVKRIKIAGSRDNAISHYRDWHCEQVDDDNWKRDFYRIAELTFKARLTLNRLFEAQEDEMGFFISNKFPRGIAHQWVSMVDEWVTSRNKDL